MKLLLGGSEGDSGAFDGVKKSYKEIVPSDFLHSIRSSIYGPSKLAFFAMACNSVLDPLRGPKLTILGCAQEPEIGPVGHPDH